MLKITSLEKSYGARKAVDGISLDARMGEIFGLLGPNGAGKSTTVNMCAGLLAPDHGTVELAGGSPTRPEIRRRI
ncbi:MAG: ATP-binding cassette domain-containing protein, partial [Phycisphaerales bacterium]|nr:ATP-binding cassette domain-containing protein [Phycisphaerales bacterium]